MERRTQVLLGLAVAIGVAASGALAVALIPGEPTFEATWVSEPPAEAGGNHHGPAVGTVDGETLVYAPISGQAGGPACGLVALDAENGESVWRHDVPPADCTVHAVADPTVTDWRGEPAVLVATTENAVFDLDPSSGAVRTQYDLSTYGYSPPQVVDLVPGGDPELVIADAKGTVLVLESNGSVAWQESFGGSVWATPVVAAVSGGGAPQVVIGTSEGRVVVLDRHGGIVRDIEDPIDGAVTWMTHGQLDDDPALEIVVGTTRGQVVALDGATGAVEWTESFDSFTAVRAVGDADGDGANEVFVTAADGVVRALDGETGQLNWEREVAASDVQMMPPPVLADVTGDGVAELVVASNDGRVVALEAASGTIVASYQRDRAIFEAPTFADVDDDRRQELFVIYDDGAVVRLDFER